MERSTLYAYGLILMTAILMLVMILFAQPAGLYIREGLSNLGDSVVSIGDNVTSDEAEKEMEDLFEREEDKIHINID